MGGSSKYAQSMDQAGQQLHAAFERAADMSQCSTGAPGLEKAAGEWQQALSADAPDGQLPVGTQSLSPESREVAKMAKRCDWGPGQG